MGRYLEDGNLQCDNCSVAVDVLDNFCYRCGHDVSMICKVCGQEMQPSDQPLQYCPLCGLSTPELPREREGRYNRYRLDKYAALTAAAALVVEYEIGTVRMVGLLSRFTPAELGELDKHIDRLTSLHERNALNRFLHVASQIGCLQLAMLDDETIQKVLGLLRTIERLDAEILDPRLEGGYFELAPEAAELRHGLKQLDPELYRAVMDCYTSL